MPSRIRKSAIYSFVEAFVRTHRRGRVKARDVRAAIDFIDAKLTQPTRHLQLPARRQGVLQNMVLMLLNAMTAYDQKPQIVAARKLLQNLTSENLSPITVEATGALTSVTAGTLSATASSTLGAIVAYQWVFTGSDNGKNAVIATPSAQNSTVALDGTGIYQFTLTVTDENGYTATATTQIQSTLE